ncbi:MAG: transglycosylase SLT domain-containing protein, partial [Gemmatimonadales bacterium]|nr:transglycosylase SLT domain-containing protein [Gemmatimonadales bacterium]
PAPAPAPERAPAVAAPSEATPGPVAAIPAPPRLGPDLAQEAARLLESELRRDRERERDAAILERLDAPTPGVATDAPGGANPLAEGNATWDLDVASYAEHDRVQYWLDFFQTTARERMTVWLARMPRYEARIRERLQQRGLPADLVYLALIESGYSNVATSRARAVGMWQFMRPTGRMYGLRVDAWVDERRDWPRATDAAAAFLADLHRRFGSTYLAAAAYNAGGGKISRSLRAADRMGRFAGMDEPEEEEPEEGEEEAGPATGAPAFTDEHFFRLFDTRLLRQETRDYVPKLIAAALIAKEPQKYGFVVPPPPPDAGLPDSVAVTGLATLDVLAEAADTTLDALRELNPHLLRLAAPPQATTTIRVPRGRGARVDSVLAARPREQWSSVRLHVLGKGETVAAVAERYGVREADVREANPRARAGRARAGMPLAVPTGGALSVAVARFLALPAAPATARVRRRETLVAFAQRHGVTVRELRAWNGLSRKTTRVRAGTRLRVEAPGDGAVLAMAPAPRAKGDVGERAGAAPRSAAAPRAKAKAKAGAAAPTRSVAKAKRRPAPAATARPKTTNGPRVAARAPVKRKKPAAPAKRTLARRP